VRKTSELSGNLGDDTANVGEEEQDDEAVEHKPIPVLFAGHLDDTLAGSRRRSICLLHVVACLID